MFAICAAVWGAYRLASVYGIAIASTPQVSSLSEPAMIIGIFNGDLVPYLFGDVTMEAAGRGRSRR